MECSMCGELIMMVRTSKGSVMPINKQPSHDGNIVIDGGIARVLRKGEETDANIDRYVSHFATCPYDDWFRKDRK